MNALGKRRSTCRRPPQAPFLALGYTVIGSHCPTANRFVIPFEFDGRTETATKAESVILLDIRQKAGREVSRIPPSGIAPQRNVKSWDCLRQ